LNRQETEQLIGSPEEPDAVSAAPVLTSELAAEAAAGRAVQPVIATGSLTRQLLTLALPMLGEQVLNFLVGWVDTYLAGTISKEATAAVGTAAYMAWFVTQGFILVSVGAAAIVSRSFGAREVPTANRAMNQAVLLALLLGALASAAGFAVATPAARLLLDEPEASAMCAMYLRLDSLGYAAACVTFVGTAVLRASGDARTPLRIMVFVNVVNALVAASLVFGWLGLPKLGVTGIVTGSVAARTFGGLLTLVVLSRGLHGLRLRLRAMRPDPTMLWRVLRIGLPAAADTSVMSVAQFLFIAVVAHSAFGALATVNFAAHVIAIRVEALSYLPAMAWGTAAATLVGQYLGARAPARAARVGHLAFVQAVSVVTCVGVCFFVFAGPIFDVMTSDPAVRDVGVPAFRFLAFAQPFICMSVVYLSAVKGAGDTRWPLVFSLICSLLVRVPVAWLGAAVLHGGLIGAWCGMWADNVSRSLFAVARFAHGGWARTRV
jgi:putative MATE family efflux protein